MAQSGCHRQGPAISAAGREELSAKLGWVGGGKGWSAYNGPLRKAISLLLHLLKRGIRKNEAEVERGRDRQMSWRGGGQKGRAATFFSPSCNSVGTKVSSCWSDDYRVRTALRSSAPRYLCLTLCLYSGGFLRLCEAESGPVAALVELRLFLAGFSQPPSQLTVAYTVGYFKEPPLPGYSSNLMRQL